jgi:uncharacterized protein
MTVVVAGGTGFIGRALVAALAREGYDVATVSRRPGAGTYTWDDIERQGLPNCEAVINLAGRPIDEGRWTPQTKRKILESRVETTEALVYAITQNPPKAFINASAVGYYPALIDEVWTEDRGATADESFLSQVAHEWETAARLPHSCPTREVVVRIAMVLGREGGALPKLLKPFRLGLGGRLGTGYQPVPWIHLDDLVALFLFLLRNGGASGPFNAVAPGGVDNREFTRTLAKAVHRPAVLAVPAWVLRLAWGEKADLVLHGQNAVPKRAVEMGFHFAYETLESALTDLVGAT